MWPMQTIAANVFQLFCGSTVRCFAAPYFPVRNAHAIAWRNISRSGTTEHGQYCPDAIACIHETFQLPSLNWPFSQAASCAGGSRGPLAAALTVLRRRIGRHGESLPARQPGQVSSDGASEPGMPRIHGMTARTVELRRQMSANKPAFTSASRCNTVAQPICWLAHPHDHACGDERSAARGTSRLFHHYHDVWQVTAHGKSGTIPPCLPALLRSARR